MVIPLTDNENKLFDSAPQRRDMRLLLGGR
jgi:hypothetical protein